MNKSLFLVLLFAFGMINKVAECGNLPYTRGYAAQAPHVPATNYGTAARYAPMTAGLASYATPVGPSNRGYATRASLMVYKNIGIATRINPKPQDVRVPRIRKGKKTEKAEKQ